MLTFSDEKLKKQYHLRRTAIVVLSFLLALAVLVPTAWYVQYHTVASMVFREAKNTRLALRYLTIEYAAQDKKVADASSTDGFSSGTADALRELADAKGHLQLVSWNDAANQPRILSYSRDGIVVVYTYDAAEDTERWQVSCMLPLMDFTR
jgi:hypothetical protein